MNDIFQNIKSGFFATSIWEWLGVLTGVLYVVFISYKKIIAWLFALISSTIYVYLCFKSKLFIETGLQFFYVIMAIYGWFKWNSDQTDNHGIIIQWKPKFHLINILISGLLVGLLGYIFDSYTNQANPYTDAFSTVFSLAATFMVTKKVLENWIYWIVIDAVCIYLFASRGLFLTSILFFFYTIIAVFGFVQWRREFKLQ
jgi:nicotinamide mononucleotide transporter